MPLTLLPRSLWIEIWTFLDAKEILQTAQVSKSWNNDISSEVLQRVAENTYGADLAHDAYNMHDFYKRSWRKLLRDDNRLGAYPTILLQDDDTTVCWCRDNHGDSDYYTCNVVALQYKRRSDTLRVLFEARGESDLRSPLESSVAYYDEHLDHYQGARPNRNDDPVEHTPEATTNAAYRGCMTFPSHVLGPGSGPKYFVYANGVGVAPGFVLLECADYSACVLFEGSARDAFRGKPYTSPNLDPFLKGNENYERWAGRLVPHSVLTRESTWWVDEDEYKDVEWSLVP